MLFIVGIYDTPGTQNQNNSKQNYLEQNDKFLVDIRDFISFSDNAYHFVIPDNCRKYVHELNSILFSNKTNSEKKRLRAELDGKYSKSNKGDVVWRISIPSDKLCSYLHFDSSFIPFIDKENDLEYEPTEKHVADAISFLNELFHCKSYYSLKYVNDLFIFSIILILILMIFFYFCSNQRKYVSPYKYNTF